MKTIAQRSRKTNPQSTIRNPQLPLRGFTLMELLIVMLIIAVLAALALTALQGAAEEARADRTRSIIAKLDQLIMQRYDSYRTRALPIRIAPGTRPKSEPFTDSNGNGFWNNGEPEQSGDGVGVRGAAFFRLMALRELMRMELPDRRSDVIDFTVGTYPMEGTATGMTYASLQRTFYRKALSATGGSPINTLPLANWTEQYQGAECLYLIISTMHDGDKNALDFLMPGETGDVDIDGMREILDGWGNPIEFLRWAPAYITANNVLTMQTNQVDPDSGMPLRPDPYDVIHEDARQPPPYALRPLIFSAGPDKQYDIVTDFAPVSLRYAFPDSPPFPAAAARSPNDPYITSGTDQLGMVVDAAGDGPGWADNITNHYTPTNAP
jgi:prepilin-type N-terminal cleavage/methylation domain-containing protein